MDGNPPTSSKHVVIKLLYSVAFLPLAFHENPTRAQNKQTSNPNWRSPASLLLAPALFGYSGM